MTKNIVPIRSLEDVELNRTIHTENGKTCHILHCGPDAASMIALGTLAPPAWHVQRSGQGTRGDWHGTRTYQEACDQLINGWPEGTAAAKAIALKIIPSLQRAVSHKAEYRRTMAPVGQFALNYTAIGQDRPEVFISKFKTPTLAKGSKIFRVGVNLTASAGVTPEVLQARGACVMALLMAMQATGKSVDLTAQLLQCARGSDFYLGSWHVCPAGSVVSNDRLALAMSSQGFRRHGFSMIEHSPSAVADDLFGGYGMPANMARNFPTLAAGFDTYVDSDCAYDLGTGQKRGEWTSETDQVNWVIAQLRKQGITVNV